jgi:cation:H+ antiporter
MLFVAVLDTMALIRVSRLESRAIRTEYREEFGPDLATLQRSPAHNRAVNIAIFAAGVGLLVLGVHWLVEGAMDIARGLGLSETIIGLTIVAIGTSGPELATTIVATLKNDRDVAVGNLPGSSVYNILVILGITCVIPVHGIEVERAADF